MQNEMIYIGPGPADEQAAQIGDSNFTEANKAECLAFIKAIKRVCGEPPEGAMLRVKADTHEWGVYREVAVEFDGDNEAATAYAMKVDANAPTTWAAADMEPPVGRQRGR